jgi:hypothetical protein
MGDGLGSSAEYFGITESVSDRPRSQLLEGICDELHKGANDALDALETLWFADYLFPGVGNGVFEGWQDKVTAVFREFSRADLSDSSGLQAMINSYEPVWKNFGRGSLTELRRAKELLASWRGNAAEDAKTYLDGLAETYNDLGAEITVVESIAVAARDSVWSARSDLNTLAQTFRTAAEKYARDKAAAAEIALARIVTAAFVGAVTGMIGVVADLGVTAIQAGRLTAEAVGIGAANKGLGSGLEAVGSEFAARMAGDNADTIFRSFVAGTDTLRSHMKETSKRFVQTIADRSNNITPVPDPPDVSPGSSFDPSNFETTHTSKGDEKRVRDKHVDINPDGSVSQPKAPGPLQ